MTSKGGGGQGPGGGTGTIFTVDGNGNNHQMKYNFPVVLNGRFPQNSLLYGSDQNFYGTTYFGGVFDKGSIFKYNPFTFTFSKLADFDETNTGSFMSGNLIETNNCLYGLNGGGGSSSTGVIFKYNLVTNSLIKILDLDTVGQIGAGSFLKGIDGNLYTTLKVGGSYFAGTLIKVNPNTDIVTKLFNFKDTLHGSQLNGDLIQASNGKLYGTANNGGLYNEGTLFEYVFVTGVVTKLVDFDASVSKGGRPYGGLIEVSPNILYGIVPAYGQNGDGLIFEYNILTSTFTKKYDFN